MAKQPFVQVGGVLRFRYSGVAQGSPWVNGFHCTYAGTPPDVNALGPFATALGNAWATDIAPHMAQDVEMTQVQVWDLSSAEGASGNSGAPASGSVLPSPRLSAQAAVVISWPVQSRWRGGHFRTYAPGRFVNDLTNGKTLTTAYQQEMKNAFEALQVSINQIALGGTSVQLCGVRYYPTGFNSDGTPIVKTSGKPFVFGLPVVHGRIDTQRRRLGKETP